MSDTGHRRRRRNRSPSPSRARALPYDLMGADAAKMALADAGLGYDAVEQAYAGYVYGDSNMRPEVRSTGSA